MDRSQADGLLVGGFARCGYTLHFHPRCLLRRAAVMHRRRVEVLLDAMESNVSARRAPAGGVWPDGGRLQRRPLCSTRPEKRSP